MKYIELNDSFMCKQTQKYILIEDEKEENHNLLNNLLFNRKRKTYFCI